MVKLSHTSGTMHALLLLGSNKGDAYALLQSAIGSLSAEMALVEKGSVYQTAAWGFEGPPFLNQVIEVRFKGSAHALLAACLAIEVEHGRVRNPAVEGYESRSMDIDILLIANEVVDISFQYFDGEEWQSEWDSIENGGFPVAIEVNIMIDPVRSASGSQDYTVDQSDPDEMQIFRTVVDLPVAEPIESEGN